MFDSLTERLDQALKKLTGRGKLSEADVDAGLREVRLALLEADVNYKVVKDFIANIRTRAVGAEVMESLNPGQQLVKIVDEEMVRLLGDREPMTYAPSPPTVIVLAGLQGSGKTTTAGKLALFVRREGHRPLLVSTDVRRPAAMEQLEVLAKSINAPAYAPRATDPVAIARESPAEARRVNADVIIIDTAGRLQVEPELLAELKAITDAVPSQHRLLVLDAMTGQQAVNVTTAFQQTISLSGAILTKLDGDARGGAALSLRAVTHCPIQFVGVGEKLTDLEIFYPDRMASRILGMGDVLTLIEKAQEHVDASQAQEMEKKLRTGRITLTDFMEQLKQVKKMGPLEGIIGMLPGAGKIKNLAGAMPSDDQLKEMEAIILSMTPAERERPEAIDGSRRRRIARGAGTDIAAVNRLLKGFQQMQQMMKQMGKGKRITGLPIDPAQLMKG
ncbi:MAG: signal recognition particle protein [Chloroflexi bacterium]|nr:MAG: signal recognition particle protein [Chloroflexota bacterium]TME56203.1 MAG: signal recognition particle protein [Chloroflexota bacterium]